KSLHNHPVKDFLQMDVPVTLNTDDPTVSNIVLSDEYQVAMKTVGLNYNDLRKMTLTAIDSSFLSEPERQRMHRHFTRLLPSQDQLSGYIKNNVVHQK
ncbi:MAG: hypothetical protein KDE51_25570, partial [Anaerolineales bacterium]|nr:hypothetical protein [Anaerolineales bacterium]